MSKFILLEIKDQDVLYSDGDEANFFFILKSGKLELSVPDVETNIIEGGSSFGEIPLIEKNRRSGSGKCLKDSEIFCLEGLFFKDVIQKLNKNHMKEKIFFLSSIPIFKHLSNIQRQYIARGMINCDYETQEIVLNEREIGESIFIIKEGLVRCFKNGENLVDLQSNDYFGENSLIYEKNRLLTIITLEKTQCYQIIKSLLKEVLGDFRRSIIIGICQEGLNKSKYMKYFIDSDLFSTKIFPLFEIAIYKPFQIALNDNQTVNKIIIVLQGKFGQIGSYENHNHTVIATRGQLYGDTQISNGEILNKPLISLTHCISLEVFWDKIISNIGFNGEKNVFKIFSRLSQLRAIQVFKHLSDQMVIEISQNMKKKKYQDGDKIIIDGEVGNYLYVIYKGKVKVFKENKFLRELEEGGCFGELSLILNRPHSATVIASGKVSTFTFSREDFNKYFDKKMFDYLLYKISLQDNFKTKLEDFYLIQNLGEGKFGKVFLVHNCKNEFAIKAVNRKAAEKKKLLIKYILKERDILLTLDHPFIVKLVKTLKNDDYIFYLLELVKGKQMRKYLESRDTSKIHDKYEAQFYIASILIAVNYLNSKRIIHRDIKTDNIMLDERGYLKLIDFGTAIIIKDFATTITGTPHYMAPEVLLGKGYSFSADYWSIGILAYEIFFNYYPFGKGLTDPMEVYKEVVKIDLTFPRDFKDRTVISFISGLLRKKVDERVTDFEYLKHTTFFDNFKFNELIDFKLVAPYIPIDCLIRNKNLNNKKIKFIEELSKVHVKEPVISNYGDQLDENYNPNWADEF